MKRVGGTFGIPILLAVAAIVALIAGLLGDGAVDVIAWLGLAAPFVAIGWALRRTALFASDDQINRVRRRPGSVHPKHRAALPIPDIRQDPDES